jgi:hypothetical protein
MRLIGLCQKSIFGYLGTSGFGLFLDGFDPVFHLFSKFIEDVHKIC